MIKNCRRHAVHRILRQIRRDDDRCLHGDRLHRSILPRIGPCRNLQRGIIRTLGHDLIPQSSVNIQQIHTVCGRKLCNRGCRCTGYNKGRINFAVLQRFLAVLKGLVLRMNVLQRNSGSRKDIDGIEIGARARCADGDAFSLQILHRANLRIHGDQLNGLRIETSEHAEGMRRSVLLKGLRPVPGIGHDVRLRKAKLEVSVLNGLNVDLGGSRGNRRHLHIRIAGHVLGDHAAVGIIGACRSAGSEHHPGCPLPAAGKAYCDQSKCRRAGSQKSYFLHW